MKGLGNFLWFITFGLIEGISNFIFGVLCCITLVGIPFGIAYFRIAKLAFFPFGKEVTTDYESHPAGNIIWLIFGGAGMAVGCAVFGALLCVTIIGIPFAKQYFKLMRLCALPFGATVEK
jgi:uncharacterized membrane protein YccF (DUF307 family)